MKEIFKNDDAYLARWLNGELSPEELREFENSKDFSIYKRIKETTSELQSPDWDKDKTWSNIKSSSNMEESKVSANPKSRRLLWVGYAAAACLIVLVGYFAVFNNDSFTTYETLAAQMETVNLPDGSVAYMNAGSTLRFDAETFENERTLSLDGEAFFEVEKGSQFTVETANGNVRVLGTSFNVKSRDLRFDVHCYSGRVGVSLKNSTNYEILTKGDMVIVSNNKLISRVNIDKDLIGPDWRDGRSSFSNANFIEVINELERQFDIEIKYDESIKNVKGYTGGFKHDDLNLALQVVCSSINYEYKINGKTVTLTKSN